MTDSTDTTRGREPVSNSVDRGGSRFRARVLDAQGIEDTWEDHLVTAEGSRDA